MFDRMPMLGQVPVREGAGFGGPAWSVSTPVPPGFPPPMMPPAFDAGTPWICPDGTERILTRAQAMRMGCRRRTMMGQNGAPAPSPGGAPPAASVTPITVGTGDQFDQQFFPGFWPGYWPGYWPYQYPQYYPPQQQRLVCRRLEAASEREGRDVLECSYEPPAAGYPPAGYPPAYSYPAYTYPVQQLQRPLWWWF